MIVGASPVPGPGFGLDLEIRELAEDDLDEVVAIEAAGSPQPWSRSLFAAEFELDPTTRHWLVACTGGSVVGFGGLMFVHETAHLLNLGVASSCARRGIGLRLCAELLADAVGRGATELTLEVRASNSAAIALYDKLEMTAVGTRPGYYPDGEHAVIYWLYDLTGSR